MKLILEENLQRLQFTTKINKFTIAFFCFVGVILFSTQTYGQDTLVVRDLESWNSINIKYKINKKWSMSAQGQLRLKNNISEISQYFGQLDLEYSFSKHIDFSGALRYIKKNDNTGNIQGYENHLRYHVDGSYKHKIDRLNLKYRFRYQNRNELNVDDVNKQSLRLKMQAEYNIKKWKLDPELSGELFKSVGANSANELEGYRITLGTTFKLYNSAKMKIFYRYDQELNTDYPKAVNIIGVKYTYSLK